MGLAPRSFDFDVLMLDIPSARIDFNAGFCHIIVFASLPQQGCYLPDIRESIHRYLF